MPYYYVQCTVDREVSKMITFLMQLGASVYVAVLNAEIFGRSVDRVSLNILLGVLALVAFCGVWKFVFHMFHRY